MTRIGGGDRQALRQLYDQYRRPLFALAIRMTGDFGAAEEMLQDCFVKIWRTAGRYDQRKSRPFTWAVTILRRGCIDHLRRQPPAPADAPEAEGSTGDEVRAAAAGREQADQVAQALGNLADGPRAALEMALFSGLTHEEIAARLGQPLGTVKGWMRRGLSAVRSQLDEISR